MASMDNLADLLDRSAERFRESLGEMTLAEANRMPAPLIKSVTWLIWHTAREIDLQIADLWGQPALYSNAGWSQKFALDLPDDTEDWHHTPAEAAKVVVKDKQLLLDYLAASIEFAKDYFSNVGEVSLNDVVDASWDEPVTRIVRIISIVDDAVMHSGQAVYTRRLVIGR